jgi:hypothetical protein
MNLPVELVGLLKHAEIDGKKLTWDIQVIAPLFVSMLLVCGGLVRGCVVARFV